MAAKDLILCLDVGGDSIKAAEFSYVYGEGLVLEKFAYSEYSVNGEEVTEDVILQTLEDVIRNNDFQARDVHVSMSGKNSFVHFVKVPAMTSDPAKVKGMIAFEAKQSIPFSMDEVVWDYQMIEAPDDDLGTEIDAMLVIVKNDEATRITETLERLHKRVLLIEVASTACYNSARASEIGTEQCELILNIGGRCSTLVFVDGSRFFVRTIPIAGNSITQQIAKEFNIPFSEAEEMKRRHGFVALGGAYEEPESPVAATVSKIVRNVMTRLHGEINRSINMYRASRHGRKPEKLYLSGGTSILPFTPRFFSEKLRIPVEYFNPFQVVSLSPDIDQELLKDVAHLYGETIGLALRRIGTAPIEISLIPEHIRQQNIFRQKCPYFVASAIALLGYLGIALWAYQIQTSRIESKYERFEKYVEAKSQIQKSIDSAKGAYSSAEAEYKSLLTILKKRDNWILFLDQLQSLIPPRAWLSSVSISTKPIVENQEASTVVSSKRQKNPMDLFSAPPPNFAMGLPTAKKTEENTEEIWVNLEGYGYIKQKRGDRRSEGLSIQEKMSHSSKIFVGSDPRYDVVPLSDCNIVKLYFSRKLEKPINTKEFLNLAQPSKESK